MITNKIHKREEEFHDAWALSEDIQKIDIVKRNETCTSPEMRYILKKLGDIRNKKLLDVGCGLGEASVYFALKGAEVTALDISGEMLKNVRKFAEINHVSVNVHKATAESLDLTPNDKFDIIYVGNLFHHVDIDATLMKISSHIKSDGILVSWDPLAYNPLINIYRNIATDVRTEDEHPLTLKDLKKFSYYFNQVEKKWFWLTTLLIFIIMFLFQRINPNEERYWKKVVDEGEKWKYIYKPLEYVDKILFAIFPFLRPLSWNVVIFASQPVIQRKNK